MRRNCATNYGIGKIVPIPRLHKVRQLMLKRPFKSLIARIAIVALALSLVVPFVPAAFAQNGANTIEYPENGTDVVRTFVLSDQDASDGGWSVSGDDAGDFEISSDGALSFKSSPNYESPADADGDNAYKVTVSRSGGSLDVVVMVTNVDEPGSVTINDLQPQAGAGQSITANVSDPDGDTVTTAWQWSRSMDQAEWEDIAGAISSTYTPRSGDAGYYLRATATYSDGQGSGRDSASAESAFAVELRPAANSAPSFEGQDETAPTVDDDTTVDAAGIQDNIVVNRSVKETAKVGSSIGNPVVATDDDNDPLLYSLADYNDPEQEDADEVDDAQWFAVDDKTGQLSVTTKESQDDVTAAFNQDVVEAERTESFMVDITATDPSGADTRVTVTINVTAVDEAPTITRDPTNDLGEGATITVRGDDFVVETDEENPFNPDTIGSSIGTTAGLPVFEATDPEGKNADIRWSVIGVDANRFIIVDIRAENADADAAARATLRFTAPSPSFEAMDSADGDNVYVVMVRATDGSSSSSKTMSVTVRNIEEPGKIGLSQLEPQEGIAITARLSDPDGDISATKWQWYRGAVTVEDADTDPVNGIQADELTARTDDTKCDDDTTTDCWIGGATSSTYIPKATDAGSTLTVVATYVDAFVTDSDGDTVSDDDGDIVIKTSDNEAVVRPNANDQPSFLDDDPASRSVDENAKGASVGDPVTATDEQPLLYTLSGDGSDAFKVDGSGQISTAEKLDYETRSSYAITVTATDPSLASSSIMVNITVNDTDDPAVISAGASIEYPENGTDVVRTFVLSDQDASDGGWSVSGDDAGDFEISSDGALSFKSSPNYESPADADGDNAYKVTVSRSGGSLDVVVMVTNVDEPGSVTINDLQPQAGAGQSITANVSDPDGDTVTTAWQWSRSMDQAEWEDIAGAISSTYTPRSGDAGYYLRATATYSDGQGSGRDSASAESAFAVELRPAANSAPSFEGQDETAPTVDDDTTVDAAGIQDNIVVNRSVKETAKVGSSIGNPVVATDDDNDPLLYSLADYNDPEQEDADEVDDAQWFAVDDKTGQLSVTTKESQDDVTAAFNQDVVEAERTESFMVDITATDPSGADTRVTVTINVTAVDEAPTITRDPTNDLGEGATITVRGDDFVVETDEENPFNPDTIGSSIGNHGRSPRVRGDRSGR